MSGTSGTVVFQKSRLRGDLERFRKWSGSFDDEEWIQGRAQTFFDDYYAFESLKHHDPVTVTNFQQVVVQAIVAYRHMLKKVERQDLWDKYFAPWADEVLHGS
jgi:hypothetical protein